MDDYAIYTYGGGRVLWKLFNAIAVIFKSDSDYMTGFLPLTAVIGGVWATSYALLKTNIGYFAKSWFAPMFLITNLLLLPKAQVNIIDRVDKSFHYSAVKNVPVGFAMLAGIPSTIFDSLALMLEDALGTPESQKYSNVGPLFGARLAMKASRLTIKDPTMRQNLKNFMGQCFMWPYIYTDIKPGRDAALKTTNILEFIEENAHGNLGTYWTERGQTKYLSCKRCVKQVALIMRTINPNNNIPSLVSGLFGSSGKSNDSNRATLMSYFEDAWSAIARDTADIHQVCSQNIMINAFRENLDDRREEHGMERLDPGLLTLANARAIEQQRLSQLQKFLLAGEELPMLQSLAFAFLLALLIVVIPFAFIPGGLKFFTNVSKLFISVTAWPVLYAIFNAVAHMFLDQSQMARTLTDGLGLSIATQSGLQEAAYNAYCNAVGMMMSIPIISFALVFGSSYALGQIFSSQMDALGQTASRFSADAVDGNVNYDNQSIGNSNLFGYQIAQQNLAPHLNSGETINDGAMNMTYGPGGKIAGTAAISNLPTVVNEMESLANMSQQQFTDSYQKLGQNALSYADHLAHSTSNGTGLTLSESAERRESAENFMRTATDFAQKFGVSKEAAISAGLGFGLPAGAPINGSVGVNASLKTQEDLSKALQSSEGQALTKAASKVESFATQDHHNAADSRTRDHADNFMQSKIATQNWANISSFAKENRSSIQTNTTDEVLDMAAQSMFGGNKAAAINWANDNRHEFEHYAQGAISHQMNNISEQVRNVDHVLSAPETSQLFQPNGNLIQGAQMPDMRAEDLLARNNNQMSQIKDELKDQTKIMEKQLNQDRFDARPGGKIMGPIDRIGLFRDKFKGDR